MKLTVQQLKTLIREAVRTQGPPTQRKPLGLPQVYTAQDYHDFDLILEVVKTFVPNAKLEELDAMSDDGLYMCLVYTVKDGAYKKLKAETLAAHSLAAF